ncbi:ECF transporter S component [Brachybacterium paraconglomeratum]|uniref:ECF transporter S component n=1 Tax=Brachybacterium paraconglomeratum TaxID=173362 RepID=UPI0035179BAB
MTEEHGTAAPAHESAAPDAAPADVGATAPGGATAPAGTSGRRTPLSLRELVLVVVLGVVFGFLYWVFVQAWNGLAIAMGPAGDLAQHLVFGSWLLVAPVAIAILRRPGVGILAEMLAAVIEVVFLGSPVGPLLLLSAALQGIGSELPFALTRYRRFGWGVFAASGALGAGLVFFWTAYRMGWYGQDLLALRLGVQVLSGIVLGGLLARVIVRALERTGVLADFAIGAAAAARIPERRVR